MSAASKRFCTMITGASAGIGKELAYLFAQQNADLILVARRRDLLLSLQAELAKKSKGDVHILCQDLSEPGAAESLWNSVLQLELSVNILVNNAGVGMCGPFAQGEPEAITRMLHLNITSLTQLTRLCLGPMLQRGEGRVLNVASTAAFQPGPLMSVYYASKAYVLHFSEGLASELAGTGVSVTALCPGPTRTEFQEVAGMSHARLNRMPFFQTAAQVATIGYEALMRGKVVAISGWMNWWMALSIRFLPRFLVRKVVGRLNAGAS